MMQTRVSLLITCVVDQFFPLVGESVVRLLERLGVTVTFNPRQTCCGQPAFNTGYRRYARDLARRMLDLFPGDDYLVAPSGSCVSMIRLYYPELFKDDPRLAERARALGRRVYELSDFLVNVLGVEDVGARYRGRVTYHDGCHLLRELRVREEPRRLIRAVQGIEFIEMEEADACCGFGGTFSVKLAGVSAALARDKIERIQRTGADAVIACDSSCLMHIAGMLGRCGSAIRTMHLAELLAAE
ncbi:MAG TPA: (Fe-S)-binding protein [Blastocatellia bacterium]|nr:(Fe-S)-binding protein [Blastocatellia bacterium]